MTLVKYRTPQHTFNSFVNRFFNDVYHNHGAATTANTGNTSTTGSRSFAPSVDVAETDAAFEVQVIVPGLSREDIAISLENEKLTISGERTQPEAEGRNYRRVESAYGNFSRSFYLPDNIDSNNIGAKYENGILLVTIPKKEVKPLKTTITVQ